MQGIVITSRPIMPSRHPFLLLQDEKRLLQTFALEKNMPITISVNKSDRYCSGWYDINLHESHICDQNRTLDPKFAACFDCRNKTGFNPAFYSSDTISSIQASYNRQPHSVYVAYFGSGLAKAGIMSDSRGLERIFEQGALMYVNLGSFPNAGQAHELETSLIAKGLKNSISKRQKEAILQTRFNEIEEQEKFAKVLKGLDLTEDLEIICNLDHFFFGLPPSQSVTPIHGDIASGRISGMIGRYLVLDNHDRLLGFWLSDLPGYLINIADTIQHIEAKPLQSTLF